MFDKENLEQLKKSHKEWENTVNTKVVTTRPERKKEFETSSITEEVYTPADIENLI